MEHVVAAKEVVLSTYLGHGKWVGDYYGQTATCYNKVWVTELSLFVANYMS